MHWFWGTTACVPVARDGRDIRAARLGLRRLQEGRVVVVFPEGTLSGAGMGRLRTPRCGAAFLALRGKVPVFPAFISGGPQHPDVGRGWLWPSKRRVRIVFGPALDLSAYHGRPINRALLEEVTQFLMEQIAALDPRRKRRPDCP
jgi:1-acyl-sn-glycerol-3-phosphate acyltransferase